MKFKNKFKDFIVINPLMVGGIVPEDVQKQLYEERWMNEGYVVCHSCIKGRSSCVTQPPIDEFLNEVAEFYGGDVAEHTFGCRAAQFAVMRTVAENVKEGKCCNIVIADSNSHYTTTIAAEMCDLKVIEPPHSGYPEYKINAESFATKIEEVKKDKGKPPALVVLTHADPYYGNIEPVNEVGKICEEYGIPYMVNAAYTGGVIPINMKEMKASFLTVSAHKSMASLAPLGFLITTHEWEKHVFKTLSQKLEWTSKTLGNKITNIFGCSIGGIPLISSMLSFDYVKERVKNWDKELSRIREFIKFMEKLGNGDITLLGENPHNHHLLHFETPIFWNISQKHKRKGFFLAEEMEKRKIVGLQKGLTKHIKLSIYGLSDEKIMKVKDAFSEIVELSKKFI
ncbi:MAG: O-phospho-L-seryl-tRNA:Cys-tRNA synthase [Candidatus Altarchaeaceae archaeon]